MRRFVLRKSPGQQQKRYGQQQKKEPALFHAELHHQRKRDEKIDDGRRCRNGERGEKLAPPGKKGGKRLHCRAERDGDHTEQKPAPEEVALPHRHGERVPLPPAALVIAERTKPAPAQQTPEYVTRAEFEAFAAQFAPKKTAKKAEVTENE